MVKEQVQQKGLIGKIIIRQGKFKNNHFVTGTVVATFSNGPGVYIEYKNGKQVNVKWIHK